MALLFSSFTFFAFLPHGGKEKKKFKNFNDVKCFLNLSTNKVPLLVEFQSLQNVQFLADNQILCFSLDQLPLVYKRQKV